LEKGGKTMADDYFGILSSAEQMKKNYEMYKKDFVDSSDDIINQETFLRLLTAEMSNQDPLEPTSNTEFISQLAQFSSMQYMLDSSKYAESNYAAGLVGKYATAIKQDGKDAITKSGIVEKVYKAPDNSYLVKIDGEEFKLSQISSVQSAPGSEGSTGLENTATSLGDSISRAAMMVGMGATVEAGENGTTVTGVIESIKVKDGKIFAVINTQDYELEKIKEVFVPLIVDPEDPNAADKTDDGSSASDNKADGDDVQKTAVGADM